MKRIWNEQGTNIERKITQHTTTEASITSHLIGRSPYFCVPIIAAFSEISECPHVTRGLGGQVASNGLWPRAGHNAGNEKMFQLCLRACFSEYIAEMHFQKNTGIKVNPLN